MKRKLFIGILCIEAVVCMVLSALQASLSSLFSAAMAFPFEQIGFALRGLSLSSVAGNLLAVLIYIILCLLPVAMLIFLKKYRSLHAEDGLLVLLSILLFVVLYLMINPGIIGTFTGGITGLSVGKAVFGGMVYSVLMGYFVLRALRLFTAGDVKNLMGYMAVMLKLSGVLFVLMAFYVCFSGLLGAVAALKAGNAGNEHLLGPSYVFLVLEYLVKMLPYILNVLVVFAALQLVEEIQKNRYSAEMVAAAESMGNLCRAALTVTILSSIGFSLLQLLFAKSLMVLNSTVQIPVFSIAFVLAALLLSRFATEIKQLKDDNDSFI